MVPLFSLYFTEFLEMMTCHLDGVGLLIENRLFLPLCILITELFLKAALELSGSLECSLS